MNKVFISPNTIRAVGACAALAGTSILAPTVSAELIAYEGFDYETESGGPFGGPNNLDGLGGTENGWAGSWSDINRRVSPAASAPIVEGSLAYTDASGASLAATGNAVRFLGGTEEGDQTTWLGRFFANPPSREPGTVVYLSLLAQLVSEPTDPTSYPNETYDYEYPFGENLYPNAATITLLGDPARDQDWDVRIGSTSRSPEEPAVWKLQGEDVGKHRNDYIGIPEPMWDDPEDFAVLKIEWFATTLEDGEGVVHDLVGTTLTLYVNPLLESEEANEGTGVSADIYNNNITAQTPFQVKFDGVGPMVGAAGEWWTADNLTGFMPPSEMLVDEIRVGTTWADVTPVGDGTGGGGEDPMEAALAYFGTDDPEEDFWINAETSIEWLYAEHYPWVYSYHHGWLYTYRSESGFVTGGWFYNLSEGNFWYTRADAYPWVFVYPQNGWMDLSAGE